MCYHNTKATRRRSCKSYNIKYVWKKNVLKKCLVQWWHEEIKQKKSKDSQNGTKKDKKKRKEKTKKSIKMNSSYDYGSHLPLVLHSVIA